MKKALVIIGCGIVLASVFYSLGMKPTETVSQVSYSTKEVTLGNTQYILEVADTPMLRERGLSYRTSLAPQTGMLFVFDTPGVLKFWMKDMNFPIDIIWLDADKKVVHIEHSLSPQTYPQSFGPDIPTQYVIELGAGEAQKTGIKVGSRVSINTFVSEK